MRPPTIENAIISATRLGIEDHSIFTAWVTIKGDGWGVSFGGYAFDQWSEAQKRRVGADYGIEFMSRLMAAVGVESWEKLPGTHVRAELEGMGGRCLRLGHILKNQWFDPELLAADMKKHEEAVSR